VLVHRKFQVLMNTDGCALRGCQRRTQRHAWLNLSAQALYVPVCGPMSSEVVDVLPCRLIGRVEHAFRGCGA
jgi:hypothetical protein